MRLHAVHLVQTYQPRSTAMNRTAQFRSFAEFYPYYLGEHSNPPAAACILSAPAW